MKDVNVGGGGTRRDGYLKWREATVRDSGLSSTTLAPPTTTVLTPFRVIIKVKISS